MPDRVARPMAPGVVLLASYDRRGEQTERFRAVCLTPDEARRLGIALVCAADRAEETTA